MKNSPVILSAGQVGKLFGVDPKTVRRWAIAGKVPSFRTPGGHLRFHGEDIQAAMGGGKKRHRILSSKEWQELLKENT